MITDEEYAIAKEIARQRRRLIETMQKRMNFDEYLENYQKFTQMIAKGLECFNMDGKLFDIPETE